MMSSTGSSCHTPTNWTMAARKLVELAMSRPSANFSHCLPDVRQCAPSEENTIIHTTKFHGRSSKFGIPVKAPSFHTIMLPDETNAGNST